MSSHSRRPARRWLSAFLSIMAFLMACTATSFAAAPTFTSITNGAVGDTVTVTGTNFNDNNGASQANVKFSDNTGNPSINANATNVTATSFNVTVPPGARTGPITITDTENITIGPFPYVVLPRVTGFNPTEGLAAVTGSATQQGTLVNINGLNFFDRVPGNSQVSAVFFGAVRVDDTDVTVLSDTQLQVRVPAGVDPGNVKIAVAAFASNGADLRGPDSSSAFKVLSVNSGGIQFLNPSPIDVLERETLPASPSNSNSTIRTLTLNLAQSNATSGTQDVAPAKDVQVRLKVVSSNGDADLPLPRIEVVGDAGNQAPYNNVDFFISGDTSTSSTYITFPAGRTDTKYYVRLVNAGDDARQADQTLTVTAQIINNNSDPYYPQVGGLSQSTISGFRRDRHAIVVNTATVLRTSETDATTYPNRNSPNRTRIRIDLQAIDGLTASNSPQPGDFFLDSDGEGRDNNEDGTNNNDNRPLFDVLVTVTSSKPAEGVISYYVIKPNASDQDVPPDGENGKRIDIQPIYGTTQQVLFSTSASSDEYYKYPHYIEVKGVDDSNFDQDQPYTVTVTKVQSADSEYNNLPTTLPVTIINTDDETNTAQTGQPGVLFTPPNVAGQTPTFGPPTGKETSENGQTAQFRVRLNSQPSSDVVLHLQSNNINEGKLVVPGSAGVTAESIDLTFTPNTTVNPPAGTSRWDVDQIVTVKGIDDAIQDGDITYFVITSITSSDPTYNQIDPPDILLVNHDNEQPGITVAPSAVTITEGSNGTFTVVLNTQPTADVFVDITVPNDKGAVDKQRLRFTPNTDPDPNNPTVTEAWNVPQTVRVTPTNDRINNLAGSQDFSVTLNATSSDANYNGKTSTVQVRVLNDDQAGFIITPQGPFSGNRLVTNESGGTATFTVALASQPNSSVTLSFTSSNTAEGTVSPASVTFDATNFDTPQTVTLTGQDDGNLDGDINYTIVTNAATSSDADYNNLNPADVLAVNQDNDAPRLALTIDNNTFPERSSVTATLTRQGTSNAAALPVNVSSSNLGAARVNGSPTNPTVVTIPAGQDSVTFTVDGVNDAVTNANRTATITAAAGGFASAQVNVTVLDDDNGALVLSFTSTTASEGAGPNAITGTVTLGTGADGATPVVAGAGGVTVTLTSSDTTAATVPATVLVPAGSSSVDFPINAINDVLADGSQDALITATAPSYALDAKTVTITDDETATLFLSISPNTITENGTTTTGTVRRNTPTTNALLVTLSSSDTSEATVPTSVLIPAGQPTATFTVTPEDDAFADGPKTVTITASSTDTTYGPITDGTSTVTVNDDDTKTLTVTLAPSTVAEGGTSTGTVTRNEEPATAGAIVVNLTSSSPDAQVDGDPTPGNQNQTTVTIPANQASATFEVFTTDDAIANGQRQAQINADLSSYTSSPAATLTINDNDTAALTLNITGATTFSEGDGNAASTATVTRNTATTNALVVDLSSSSPTNATVPATVTIPAGQTTSAPFNINAVDDGDFADGDQTVTITASSTDTTYGPITSDSDTVTVTDNDTPTLTLTIAPDPIAESGTATGTVTRNTPTTAPLTVTLGSSDNSAATVPASVTIPANAASTTFTVTGVNDDVADGDQTATITASSGGFTSGTDTITVTNDDSVGVDVTAAPNLITNEAGGQAQFTLKLTSQPSANVTIGLTSSDTTEGTVSPASVTFTPANWNTPQTVTATGVNDDVKDGNIVYTIVTQAAASGDAAYNGFNPADVSVTNVDDDTTSILVTPTSGLVTSESGGSATFKVRLGSQPTANVTIALSSSDTSEGLPSPSSLTFTGVNWNVEQTVTVTGVDDAVKDGNIAYTIVTQAATSADAEYNGLNAADVGVTNTDDDIAGVVLTPAGGLATSEAGKTDSFTIRLSSQPSANVTIGLSSSDTSEGTVAPTSVTFTSANWNTPQTVTVSGVNDDVKDGNVNYTIVTAAAVSGDTDYNGVNAPDVTVTNLDDNDQPGIQVSPTSGLTTTEAGGTATFGVQLSSQPSSDVTINVVSSDSTEGTVSSGVLTFTPANWSTPQMVTVTGVDDDEQDGNISYTIALAPAISGDNTYAGLDPDDVAVVNTDNDVAGFTFSRTSGLVTTEAGGSATFTIRLNSRPTANVAFNLAPSNRGEGAVSPATLTFTPANWNVEQTVTVKGVDDDAADGDIAYLVNTSVAASGDLNYKNFNIPDVAVTNIDNDVAGVVLTSSGNLVTTEAGGTATFEVTLKSRPTEKVGVGILSADPTEGKAIPSALTFTPGNWNRPQTVTVTGVNDYNVDGDITYRVIVSRVVSANRAYNLLRAADLPSVTLTNTDDDDTTAPVLKVTTPVNNGTYGSRLTATGTASDAGLTASGLKVTGRLFRYANPAEGTTAGYFAGGNTFTATYNPAVNERPANGTKNWTLELPTLTPGRYQFRARAVDGRGNVTVSPLAIFTVSDARPVVTISAPTADSFVSELKSITGTAVPAAGLSVSKVAVSIRRLSDGFTFNGTTFVPTSAGVLATVSGRTYALTDNLPSKSQLVGGAYEITATATDSAGNMGSATRTFRVDATAPTTVRITSPQDRETVDALTTVTGTVEDNEGGSGIGRVEVVILRISDNTYFNGSTFVPLPSGGVIPSARAAVSGNTFRWAGRLPDDPDAFNSFYQVQAIAYDQAGNRTASNTVRVGVAPPQVSTSQGAAASTVGLSIGSADAKTGTVVLTFSAPLNTDSLADARFTATANGEAVTVEGASFRNATTLVLVLAEGAVASGDKVDVQWSGLRDRAGKTVSGHSGNLTAK